MHLIWPPFWIEYFPPFSVAGDPSEQKKKEAESNYSEEGGQIKNIDTVAFVKIKVTRRIRNFVHNKNTIFFFCINDKNGFYKHHFVSIHLSDEGQV